MPKRVPEGSVRTSSSARRASPGIVPGPERTESLPEGVLEQARREPRRRRAERFALGEEVEDLLPELQEPRLGQLAVADPSPAARRGRPGTTRRSPACRRARGRRPPGHAGWWMDSSIFRSELCRVGLRGFPKVRATSAASSATSPSESGSVARAFSAGSESRGLVTGSPRKKSAHCRPSASEVASSGRGPSRTRQLCRVRPIRVRSAAVPCRAGGSVVLGGGPSRSTSSPMSR